MLLFVLAVGRGKVNHVVVALTLFNTTELCSFVRTLYLSNFTVASVLQNEKGNKVKISFLAE